MLHHFSKLFLALFIFAGLFSACKKDKDPEPVVIPIDTVATPPVDTTTTPPVDTTTTPPVDTTTIPNPIAISILGSDFAKYQGVGSKFTSKGLNFSKIKAIPTEGANQVWDLRSYSSATAPNYKNYDRLPVPDSTSLTSATYIIMLPSTFSSAFTVADFYEVSDDSFSRLGGKVNAAVANLGNGTTLTAKGEENPFVSKNLIYKFPLNYENKSISQSVLQEKYTLTAPSFGLSNAPVARKLSIQTESEVVGWGKIALPEGALVDSIEVLLVREKQFSTLNYFLNGSTAPSALTSALGLVEGAKEQVISYTFISKEFGEIARMRFNAKSDGTPLFPAIEASYMLTKQQ